MAQRITINQKKGHRGTGLIVVAANTSGFISTSANSPAGNRANTAGETISAMHIAELAWSGEAGAKVSVLRGGNTLFIAYNSGFIDFQANQMRLEHAAGGDAQANVVWTVVGNINFVIKIHKNSGA